jgi:Ras-related protein Rab-11A
MRGKGSNMPEEESTMSRAKMEFAEGIFRTNFKVCVIGDGGVGKTALIQHLLGKEFTSNYLLTIGTDISTYQLNYDGQILNIQLWDLAGQTRFDVVRNLYFSGARAGILVFDLTRQTSLHSILKWKDEIFTYSDRIIPLIILGNKSDLGDAHFPYFETLEEIKNEIQQEYNTAYEDNQMKVPFYTTSAKTGENVVKAFESLGSELLIYQKQFMVLQRKTQEDS